MRGRTSQIKISLSHEQRETLESWLRRQKTPVGLAKCARAILLLADGERFNQIKRQSGWARENVISGSGQNALLSRE